MSNSHLAFQPQWAVSHQAFPKRSALCTHGFHISGFKHKLKIDSEKRLGTEHVQVFPVSLLPEQYSVTMLHTAVTSY